MTQIDVPVTWVYGRADAWMDVDRVKDILSQGDSSARCLVGTPMGHMLRSSQEALSIFHFVACELSRMAGKAQVLPVRPALPELVRRQQAERKRRPAARPDLRRFWETYLLGGEEGGGYGVLTAISPFAEFMKSQIASLEVNTESVVVDLGSGTGEFLAHVGRVPKRVIELDLVRAALLQVREKMEGARGEVDFVQTDLGSSIPLASESADRVIASLLLSYVPNPERLLREIQRVLRPGGRLVASTLIADADMSKLYVEGVQELKTGLGAASEGIASDQVLRSFTNHASRLLDLEEQGDFRFWEPDTFRRLLTRTGWEVHSLARSFGRPPQAIIISASKPG